MDFGSTLGGGDFVNGPYRIGHEYIFDGPAIGRSLVTLGVWRRPWEAKGQIRYPEVGYFQYEIFDPRKWKPNYPNLAFERMDDADAYWGAKIVTAYSDGLIEQLAEAGEYSRHEVTNYVANTLKRRATSSETIGWTASPRSRNSGCGGAAWNFAISPSSADMQVRTRGEYRLRGENNIAIQASRSKRGGLAAKVLRSHRAGSLRPHSAFTALDRVRNDARANGRRPQRWCSGRRGTYPI